MPAIANFPDGYVYQPKRIAEVIQERTERGDLVMAAAAPGIAGAYRRARDQGVTRVVLRQYEIPLLGKHRRGYLQRRGTCVSRGLARGCQISLDFAIATGAELLEPVEVTFAPIYSLARVEVGKNRCGYGDGAILADACQAVHDYGVATTALFAGKTEDQIEQLACQYADPRSRTPDTWKAACFGHTCKTYCTDTLELIFDCLTSGYAVPYACGYVTGSPDKNGLSRLGNYGPHCRCFSGWYLDSNGVTQLISSESWGRFPAGQPHDEDQTMPVEQIPCITLLTSEGPLVLPPSEVGVDSKQFFACIQNSGEAWAVGAPQFLGDSIADTTTVTIPA